MFLQATWLAPSWMSLGSFVIQLIHTYRFRLSHSLDHKCNWNRRTSFYRLNVLDKLIPAYTRRCLRSIGRIVADSLPCKYTRIQVLYCDRLRPGRSTHGVLHTHLCRRKDFLRSFCSRDCMRGALLKKFERLVFVIISFHSFTIDRWKFFMHDLQLRAIKVSFCSWVAVSKSDRAGWLLTVGHTYLFSLYFFQRRDKHLNEPLLFKQRLFSGQPCVLIRHSLTSTHWSPSALYPSLHAQ